MKKAALLLLLCPALSSAQFQLHDGDRVVFYGDSITEQRLYTLFTEAFVRTRFPKLRATFTHSGWGGDRVGGGGGGPIDLRLDRDVLAYRPTVVTIMLGMNDASYRAFDQGIYDTYATGYRHILDRLSTGAPGVRLTLIQPSPYDDVTRPPSFEGGYNGTLLRYSEFVRDLGTRRGATVADLNTPVVDMLRVSLGKNPDAAKWIIPDRIHPGDAGHLIMAEGLLKAWKAPSLVSKVAFANGKLVTTENATVSQVKGGVGLSWTQLDGALPFWINLDDQVIRLAVESSDFVQALNQQIVQVSELQGSHILTIDGKTVGTFTADQLAKGVNLATLDTPMRAQAQRTFDLVRDRVEAHHVRWRSLQTHWWLGNEKAAEKEKLAAMGALDKYAAALDKEAIKSAQPKPHLFTLVPVR